MCLSEPKDFPFGEGRGHIQYLIESEWVLNIMYIQAIFDKNRDNANVLIMSCHLIFFPERKFESYLLLNHQKYLTVIY